MYYAIIKSDETQLLEVIRLANHFESEWKNFKTVKDKKTKSIKWFYKESEAIKFMKANFSESAINPKYTKFMDKTGRYYVD